MDRPNYINHHGVIGVGIHTKKTDKLFQLRAPSFGTSVKIQWTSIFWGGVQCEFVCTN